MTREEIIELTAKAMKLGKKQYKIIKENGKKYYLCGTCLVYEDDLCEHIRDSFQLLASIFEAELDEDDLENEVSETRDIILEKFEKLTNGKFIYGGSSY